jgi:tetratricopeptide (TPR) repeat protein
MRFTGIALIFAAIALAAQEPSAEDLMNTAISEQQSGQYEAAIRDYRKVLQLSPEMVTAKVNMGAALARLGQYDEAVTAYKSALPSLTYKNPVILNLGLAYYKKGDFADAHEQFEALHKLQPHDVRTAILLGDTDIKLRKFEDAATLLSPLDANNSQNLDFQYVYGSALIAVGRRKEGIPRLERVGGGTSSADAYYLAGTTSLEINDYDRARKDLEAALALNPKLPNLYTMVGEARDKTGDAKAAEPAFREALKTNPDDFEANLYLGAILYKRREMDEAKTYLERALKIKPSDTMARYEVAMLRSTSGDYETAVQQLEQLVKDDPNWLDPHVELASLYYKLHRPQDGARERQIVDRLTAEQQSKGPVR